MAAEYGDLSAQAQAERTHNERLSLWMATVVGTTAVGGSGTGTRRSNKVAQLCAAVHWHGLAGCGSLTEALRAQANTVRAYS